MQITRSMTPFGIKDQFSEGEEVLWTKYVFLKPRDTPTLLLLAAFALVALAAALWF